MSDYKFIIDTALFIHIVLHDTVRARNTIKYICNYTAVLTAGRGCLKFETGVS